MCKTFRALAIAVAYTFSAHGQNIAPTEKPEIRAITAFVTVDRSRLDEQIHSAVAKLRELKKSIEARGYTVQDLRIATQPFGEYTRGLTRADAISLLRRIDQLGQVAGFLPAVGPAMVRDDDDAQNAEILAEALKTAKVLHGTVIVASASGIHWNAVRAAARVVKDLAASSPSGLGNFNFAAIAMLGPKGPFFPGAYNMGPSGDFAIAWQAANVVTQALTGTTGTPTKAEHQLESALNLHAIAIETAAQQAARKVGWRYAGLDVSPAPLREVSIGEAVEKFTGKPFGSSGTLSAAALITRVLQRLKVKRTGYSGFMIPVLEDSKLAQRWSEGRISIDSLLAYSAVCGTGLDTVPLPGEVTEDQIGRIIGDVAALAFRWNKPLTARLMPVAGKRAGDMTTFDDPFIVNTRLQALP